MFRIRTKWVGNINQYRLIIDDETIFSRRSISKSLKKLITKKINSIFLTMSSTGIIRKFFLFLSFLAILLPQVLFAFCTRANDEITKDSSAISIPKSKGKILHFSEGTFIYGIDNVSQQSPTVSSYHKKKKAKLKNKKQHYFTKTEEKKHVVKKVKQELLKKTCISKNSDVFFDIAGKHFREGTVNTNLQYKVSIFSHVSQVNNIKQNDTNSLYSYSFFIKGGMVSASYFTRPPPFLA